MSLNERIEQLEAQIIALTEKIKDLTKGTEQKPILPYSVGGSSPNRGSIHPVDISSGASAAFGGAVLWNDSELNSPPINVEPPLPTKGYNKHTHSRYSGGALLFDNVEVVEYEYDSIINKESQAYWPSQPEIKKILNSDGESVDKIGFIDFVFNPDTKKWSTAAGEIDVKNCYLVERDSEGNIVTDSKGQEKKSALYNEDPTKTSIIWDENAKVWRFYAVYSA